MLAARAAERGEHVPGDVVAALDRDFLDRVRHVRHRDLQEAGRHLRAGARLPARRGDLPGELGEALGRGRGVQRLISTRAEHPREVIGLDPAEHQVGVGHGERTATPVAGGPRAGAGRVRPDAVAAAVEVQDRPAAGGDSVNAQHRRPHPHTGYLGLVLPLELAGEVRHVGGRAAHVEPDDLTEPGRGAAAGHADDAAGRAGQDRVLAPEPARVGQPAVGLHEQHSHPRQLGRHPVNVAGQDGRQVGVHDRGVAAGHQLHQRARRVRLGHLVEADVPGDLADPGLVRRIPVPVQAHHGRGAEAVGVGGAQVGGHRVLVQRHDHVTLSADPLGRLDHPGIEHLREDDLAVEDARPVLVADAQRVGEAAGDDQHRRLTATFQQRVGGHRGAQPDRGDLVPGMGCPGGTPSTVRIPARTASWYAPGFSESSLRTASVPSGRRATTSVKVPPRSIQNSQRLAITSHPRVP